MFGSVSLLFFGKVERKNMCRELPSVAPITFNEWMIYTLEDLKPHL
jgi:hypothetical protein